MDEIEKQYIKAINIAAGKGNNDEAHDLANGLSEYRTYYKGLNES